MSVFSGLPDAGASPVEKGGGKGGWTGGEGGVGRRNGGAESYLTGFEGFVSNSS